MSRRQPDIGVSWLRLAFMGSPQEIHEAYQRALSATRAGLDEDWRAVELRNERLLWALLKRKHVAPRDQGWKIHVAASISDCPHLFADVVPFLLASGCSFKLPASIDDAVTINSGRAGKVLIGKIVTVYPPADTEVPGLAAELDRLWQSDQAPEVPTDLRIRPGSAIYIRFGAFKSTTVIQDARGLIHSAVRRPDGVLVPDERRLDGVQPPWTLSPIPSARPARHETQRELILGGHRYLFLVRLQSAPKGDTFLATDEDFAATYAVKIACRGVGDNSTGMDCCARLTRESRFLNFLAERGFKSPMLVAVADNAIVLEDIEGTPLHELPRGQIGGAFRRLVAAVAELHRLDVVHRDLKLSNALLAGTDVYLLDFELSAFAGAADAPNGGTPGYMAPERADAPALFASDIFSLGASLAHAALGVDPGTLAPGVGRLRALLTCTGQMRIAQIVAVAMNANPQKRPTACALATRLAELPDEWPTSFASCQEPPRARAVKLKHRRARKIMEAANSSARFIADRSTRPAPIAAAPGLPADAIASGLAGIILGLAAVDFATKRPRFDGATLGGAELLARDVKKSPALGFFTGQAGIAFVLALTGHKYSRGDLLAAGRELFIEAARDVVELDLFFGAAGIVWSACLLASILHAQWPLRAAEQAARGLTRSVREHGGVWVWAAAPHAVKDASLGAAHGSAGIAMALAIWGRDTGCARSRDLAHEAFLRLFQNGRTSNQGELRHKSDSEDDTNCGTWCHGSAGYLWCMLQAFGDDPALRSPIDWAVRSLIEVPLLANPGYCHGMAGQLDLWSMLARYPRLAEIARPRAALAARLLEHLGLRADNAWAWPADEPDQISPDLWTGILGPACALALFERGRWDTLFSRETLARVFAPQ